MNDAGLGLLGDQVTLFAPKLHQSNFVVKLNRSSIVEFSSKQWFTVTATVIKHVLAEGQEFAKILRSLEQFVLTVKGQNNVW